MNRAAQTLGRLARGKAKNYSKAERARRAERMRMMNAARRRNGA